MKNSISSFFATAIVLTSTSFAFADPIEGNWKTQSGETAKISSCGSSYCLTLNTDPEDNKVYTGSASLKGNTMSLTGCALKIFCKTQKWKKL